MPLRGNTYLFDVSAGLKPRPDIYTCLLKNLAESVNQVLHKLWVLFNVERIEHGGGIFINWHFFRPTQIGVQDYARVASDLVAEQVAFAFIVLPETQLGQDDCICENRALSLRIHLDWSPSGLV